MFRIFEAVSVHFTSKIIECSGCIQTSGVCEPKSIPGGLFTTIDRPDFMWAQFFQYGFNFSLISIRLEILSPELMLATAMNSLSVRVWERWVFIVSMNCYKTVYLITSSSALPPNICRWISWMDCNIRQWQANRNRRPVHRCTESEIGKFLGKKIS